MIVYRAVMDEVVHEGEQFCSDCSPHTLRYALIEAARKGDRNFLICLDCEARWTPDPADIAKAIRDWLLVFVPESPQLGAVLCPECATTNPDPLSLWSVARAILRRTPDGPLQ